jgi:hypothetical protein
VNKGIVAVDSTPDENLKDVYLIVRIYSGEDDL